MRQILIPLMLICCMTGFAQRTIQGTVTDSATAKPLEQANVMVLRGGKTVKFAKTDAHGRFSVAVMDKDQLAVTYLGYRKQVVPVPTGNTVGISLVQEDFLLKEVTVKGAPVFGRADTITYDLSRYATDRDYTLNDVLKRLPGVDIAKNGTVSYQGEPISRLTVEGLDLTGGRYRKMTEALKAKDVDKAEIIEHDQPVKALQGKVFSDDVALNIKLKDTARDRWLPTLAPQAGLGDDLYLGGKAEVMQIGRSRQQLYEGKLDRTGQQLSYDNMRLSFSSFSAPVREMSIPGWYSMPSLNSPIDAERLRRNLSHIWDVNRIVRNRDDRETRFTASYLHTTEWQTTGNESRYYFSDTPTITHESRQMHLSRDVIDLSYNQKVNQPKSYGNENLTAEFSLKDGLSDINGDITQRTKQTEMYLQNSFNRIFVRDKYQLSAFSDAELAYVPSRLWIQNDRQETNQWQAYTNNCLSWLRQRFASTFSCKAGFKADYLGVQGKQLRLILYAAPSYKWERSRMTFRAGMSIEWERFTRQSKSFLNTAPSLSLNYKQSNHTEWYAYGNYGQQTASWTSFALDSYQQNYRTFYRSSGFIPQTKTLSIGANRTYKRPIREFFWVWRASYSRWWSNAVSDLQITDGVYEYSYREQDTHGDSYSVGTDISKGIFNWRLKTRLGVKWVYSQGQQASAGRLIGFSSQTITVTPEITWSPVWCDITYNGSFARSSSRTDDNRLTPLLNWRQNLSLTKTIGKMDLTLSAVHYHNQLQASPTLNTLLADASVTWRMKKVRLSCELHNLLNQKDYVVTSYSGVSSSTTTYHLRPREIIVKTQWNL